MIYSRFYFQDKNKIPMFIGVLFIIAIISFFSILFSKTPLTSKAASVKASVTEYEISNLSPNREMTVYWRTANKESGWILIFDKNKNQLPKIYYDERDNLEKKSLRNYHYSILRQLPINAAYFKMAAGNESIITKIYENYYLISIPSSYSSTGNLKPAYGLISQPNSEPLDDAIVLLTINNAFSLSTLSKSKGEWLIPLNSFYSKNNLKLFTPADNEKVNIRIISEKYPQTTVLTLFSNLNSLPKIIAGDNYEFLQQTKVNNVLSAETDKNKGNNEISILYPRENALIPGKNPLIKGTALPKTEVVVIVEAFNSTSSRLITDADGIWRLVLPESLTPGEYKITLITKNKQGEEVQIKRNFFIAKSGEQVLGDATPEPTLTTGPTPTQQPTSAPIQSPTEPVSGSNFNGFMLSSASLIIIGLGILLAF